MDKNKDEAIFENALASTFVRGYIYGRPRNFKNITTDKLKILLIRLARSNHKKDLYSAFLILAELESSKFYDASKMHGLNEIYLNELKQKLIKDENLMVKNKKVIKDYICVVESYIQNQLKSNSRNEEFYNKVVVLKRNLIAAYNVLNRAELDIK